MLLLLRLLFVDTNKPGMKKSDFDYDPEKDDFPPRITFWIVVGALILAIYLSQVLV